MAASPTSKPKEHSPFIALTGRETLGWSVGLLAIFGWLFFLGILVGRGSVEVALYPTELQTELMAHTERQSVDRPETGDSQPAPPAVELTFYKEVKKSEEAVTKRNQVVKIKREVVRPGRVPAPNPPPKPAAAAVVATPKAQKPSSPPLPPPTAGFTIQVAAHISRDAAQSEASALTGKGFPAYFVSAQDQKGRTWYRVRVGRFNKKTAADKELSRLTALKKSAYVVKL